MHTHICILCVNIIIISIVLTPFQLILFLQHTAYVSLSDPAAPWYFTIQCSAWAASIPGWFHFNSMWEALFAAFTLTLRFRWALLVTAFGTLWNTQMCRALLYPLLYRQPSQNPAVPSKHSKPSQFSACVNLICLFLFWFACLWEVCAFCRQHGGGGRGWQGRWRTRWYTEYIEQCIIYWVM